MTSSPRRSTTRTCGCSVRPSVAATASAAGAPAGPATEPNAGPAPPSFPAGVDDERVQVERALDGLRLRAVRERRVRLDDSDERDADRVVLVAVAVRVDGAVEPGDQLIAPAVDELTAVGRRLPARDADRQDARLGRDAAQAARAVRADEDAGELRPVPLELRAVLRVRARGRVAAAFEHVDARKHAAVEVGMRRVDAGVEQRDRDAVTVEAGHADVGAVAAADAVRPCRELGGETEAGNVARTG